MKNLFLAILFALGSFLAHARSGDEVIQINIGNENFSPGESVVVTLMKLQGPRSGDLQFYYELELLNPDSTALDIPLKGITDDIYMGLTPSLEQSGEHTLLAKAYYENTSIVEPLRELIKKNRDRICEIELLLENETDPRSIEILKQEIESKIAEIELAKTDIEANRELIQEISKVINVTGNQPPGHLFAVPSNARPLFTDIQSVSGDKAAMTICATFFVEDPEDGDQFDWIVNFGDGTEVRYPNNQSWAPGFGCLEHTYFKDQRATISFTAVDKEGASFELSETVDIRTNIQGPLPQFKIEKAEKVLNDEGLAEVKVTYDLFGSRIPSDSGIYYFRLFPQGRCPDYLACPDYYGQQIPLQLVTHTYKYSGYFHSQFAMRDNLQYSKTIFAPIELDVEQFPENPDSEFLKAFFGPVALIQVDQNSVAIEDWSQGASVQFDGSASFDFSGPDENLSYHWNFGDPLSGSNFSNKMNPGHTYTSPGLYTVELKVFDQHGNESVVDHAQVYVSANEEKEIEPDFFAFRSQENANEVMFSLQPMIKLGQVANFFFFWDFGDGTGMATSTASPYKVYEESGVYDVSVTFQSISGEFVTIEKTIDTSVSDPNFRFGQTFGTSPDGIFQVGESVIFNASSLGYNLNSVEMFWDFGEGKTSSGGGDVAIQSVHFHGRGVKEPFLFITHPSNFTHEYSHTFSVGDKNLEVSSFKITQNGELTDVEFNISNPTDPTEVERVELYNFDGGYAILEGPFDSLNHSISIEGTVQPVIMVITDVDGNVSRFSADFEGTRRIAAEKFPVSKLFMEEVKKINQFGEQLRKRSNLGRGRL